MSNDPHVKRWEVITRDGTKTTVYTYTETAEVYNADGSPAKLLKEKPDQPRSRKKPTNTDTE